MHIYMKLSILFKISNEHHRSFHFCRAVLSTHFFLLDWRQVLSYDVSLLNIRLVVNSLIDLGPVYSPSSNFI
jgi:hypothetical protein